MQCGRRRGRAFGNVSRRRAKGDAEAFGGGRVLSEWQSVLIVGRCPRQLAAAGGVHGLRLTTGSLFWIAFAVGAAAVLLLFGSGFASTGEAPVILMAMSVPGALLVWPFILDVVDLFGDGWLAASLLAGVNGLVYGGVVVAIWETYRAITRFRRRPKSPG